MRSLPAVEGSVDRRVVGVVKAGEEAVRRGV